MAIGLACQANHRALDHFHCMGDAPIGGRLPGRCRSNSNLPVTGGNIFFFSNLGPLSREISGPRDRIDAGAVPRRKV